MNHEKRAAAYRIGVIILFLLAALTIGEYIIAVNLPNATVLLAIIALLKAVPILQVFMHISSLWSEEEGH